MKISYRNRVRKSCLPVIFILQSMTFATSAEAEEHVLAEEATFNLASFPGSTATHVSEIVGHDLGQAGAASQPSMAKPNNGWKGLKRNSIDPYVLHPAYQYKNDLSHGGNFKYYRWESIPFSWEKNRNPSGKASDSANAVPANVPDTTVYTDPRIIEVIVTEDEWRPVMRRARRTINAVHALNIADGLLTMRCMKRVGCAEMNPIYGRHPSIGKIAALKAFSVGLTEFLFRRSARANPWRANNTARASFALQFAITAFTLKSSF